MEAGKKKKFLKKKYYIDHLSEGYIDTFDKRGRYVINFAIKNSELCKNNKNRIISKTLKQALNIKNRISVFKLNVWPVTRPTSKNEKINKCENDFLNWGTDRD